MKVSENTSVDMPLKNLISIIGAVAIGVWAYFGIIERLNTLETDNFVSNSKRAAFNSNAFDSVTSP